MVEAAIWLMVQGDRVGAEALLQQVLRLDPTHTRARQAMRSTGATTSPGEPMPQPIPPETQPVIPRNPVRITEATPLEPLPALDRAVPPGLTRRTLTEVPGPFTSTPSALVSGLAAEETTPRPSAAQTDRQPALEPPPPPAEPAPSAPPRPTAPTAQGKAWSLEVLTGPHAGVSLPMSKRPMVIGRGLGVLDVENDPFMSAGHASFFQRGGELWISDGGSASGTWLSLDGPTRLSAGDSFSVGLQRFRYLGPVEAGSVEQPWPYGAPRPAASWRLEHVLVGARPGRTWVLRGTVTIGRESATLRFPEDDAMTSLHAELRPAGQQLEVIDRSARVGTFLALTTGGERRVTEGMRVRLGSTVFRVVAR
ncbi:MAG: FHA domain-containing protein [Myxococcota bacterium]